MHYLKNFKGFASAELDLFEPLTLLIGPNGSGKSNAIEAIELLSYIAHGYPLNEIRDIGKGSETIEVRGGLQSCLRHGSKDFTLSFGAELENKPLFYSVTISVDPQPMISDEKLFYGNENERKVIFQTIPRSTSSTSGDIIVECNNFARGGHEPQISISGNRSALSQYEDFAKECNKKKYAECLMIVEVLMYYLHSSFVFDPNPKLMRTYERIKNYNLSRDGSNLSSVLYSLSKGSESEQETLKRLLGWIKQLPDEPYNDFAFITTQLDDVIFGFKENNERNFITDARLLSDGTLRSLAVLTALETVKEKSRVVIEEFDNGLHPSRIHVLTEAIASCCKRRKLNVLVTTHNPATLNALNEEQFNGVVLCTWDKNEKTFKLLRLCDLPRFDEMIERGRLGDLVTQRIIDKYLVPKYEEEHNEKVLEWLRSST